MPKMIRRPANWPHRAEPKAKAPRPLADLCTATLWRESINAGKAKELIEALKETGPGRQALSRLGADNYQVHSVALIQIVNKDGAITKEPYYLSIKNHAASLGKLLEYFTHYESDELMSFTGAPRLDWTTLGKAHEWIAARLAGLMDGQISDVMTDASDDNYGWAAPAPPEPRNGAWERLYDDEEEWRDDNFDDIVAAFRDLLRRDFSTRRELSNMDVYDLRRVGGEVNVDAHIVINPEEWFPGFA